MEMERRQTEIDRQKDRHRQRDWGGGAEERD